MVKAFTLIELLVVTTIIVVLLALLTPALDKAIYQAEMAACAANLKGVGQGAMIYAADYKRWYPYRNGPGFGWRSVWLNDTSNATWDLRPRIRNYIPFNKMLMDPMAGQVSLEGDYSASYFFSTYELWFGWGIAAYERMNRVGDTMQYGIDRFNVLASDQDVYDYSVFQQIETSHPDKSGLLALLNRPSGNQVFSFWYTSANLTDPTNSGGFSHTRGPIDRNFSLDDGSVKRIDDVISHLRGEPDERFVDISQRGSDDQDWRSFLPPKK